MKTILYTVCLTVSFIALSFKSFSQKVTFKVNGTAACEIQIENLITNINGVTSASWDSSTKLLTVIYDESIIHYKRFYVALTIGGYDNEGSNAKDASYNALPTDCKYTRENLIH